MGSFLPLFIPTINYNTTEKMINYSNYFKLIYSSIIYNKFKKKKLIFFSSPYIHYENKTCKPCV